MMLYLQMTTDDPRGTAMWCETCDPPSRWVDAAALAGHVNAVHTDHLCEQCGEVFPLYRTYRKHPCQAAPGREACLKKQEAIDDSRKVELLSCQTKAWGEPTDNLATPSMPEFLKIEEDWEAPQIEIEEPDETDTVAEPPAPSVGETLKKVGKPLDLPFLRGVLQDGRVIGLPPKVAEAYVLPKDA